MKYYIGIDAGGTKSKCILVDEDLNIVAENIDGNGAFLIYGIETVAERFHNSIIECVNNAKIEINDIEAVSFGCAGAGGEANANKFKEGFINYSESKGIKYKNVFVTSDAIIALEGAFSGKSGAILIAGTGSILLAKDEKNVISRIGGAGRLIGDEGSGFRIGKQAFNAAIHYFDGRGPATSITDFLNKEFDINDIDSLIYKVYTEKLCPSTIAPFVLKEAEKGDERSIRIVEEEAVGLAKHVEIIQQKSRVKLRVSFMGGLLNSSYYSNLVKRLINLFAPGTEIIQPENSPEMGAVIFAKNNLTEKKQND